MAKGYYTPKKKMHWALKLLIWTVSIVGAYFLAVFIASLFIDMTFIETLKFALTFGHVKPVEPVTPIEPTVEAGKMLIGYCLG